MPLITTQQTLVIEVPRTRVVEVAPKQTDIIREIETVVVEVGVRGLQGPPGEDSTTPGPQGPPGPSFQYIHNQGVASSTWNINHNLGGYPNITTVDSAGTQVEGEIIYVDANNITVNFSAPFGGKAFLT